VRLVPVSLLARLNNLIYLISSVLYSTENVKYFLEIAEKRFSKHRVIIKVN